MRLRLIKDRLDGRPDTAFVGLTDRQFSDSIAADSDIVDLKPNDSQIFRVVETQQPSDVELAAGANSLPSVLYRRTRPRDVTVCLRDEEFRRTGGRPSEERTDNRYLAA